MSRRSAKTHTSSVSEPGIDVRSLGRDYRVGSYGSTSTAGGHPRRSSSQSASVAVTPMRRTTKSKSGSSSKQSPSTPSTSVWRDPSKQKQYREHSTSKDKTEKDVSHTLSLELAAHIQHERPRQAKGHVDDTAMKSLLNDFDNLKLRDKEVNRSTHRKIDHSLMEKAKTGETLTEQEERRARQQTQFLQSHQDECPASFYENAKDFYEHLETKDNCTLWDSRKDRK